jgi:formate-dependent phosphoribosylglycinamide formyltransferase (GAR transformylase)
MFVAADTRRSKPFEESRESWAEDLEGADVLQQHFDGPVTWIAVDVSVNLLSERASRRAEELIEWIAVEHKQSLEEIRESWKPLEESHCFDSFRDIAPITKRYLGPSPEQVLDRIPNCRSRANLTKYRLC